MRHRLFVSISGPSAVGSRLQSRQNLGALLDDLVCDFASMDFDLARKLKGDAHPLALDGCDTDNPDRVPRIADNNFFTLTPRNHKHDTTPSLERR
jgi:hypothetical protein